MIRYLFFIFFLSVYGEEKILIGIHGFMRGKSNMSLFNQEFSKDNWKFYSWSYPSQMRTIQEHGQSLVDVFNFILKKYPHHKIHFVTHSLGGLILRSALNESACPEAIKSTKAVLIAPPNQGAAYGRFLNLFKLFRDIAGDYAGKQLLTTPHGGFEALGQFPDSMQIQVIAGTCGCNPVIFEKNDGKVGLSETRLSTPHEFTTIFAGHSWICHTQAAVLIAKEFFEKP
jgi:hypothetical protein